MMNKNVWSTEDVYIDKCGKYEGEKFDITLSQDVFFKINCLMKRFPRLEWLAYLIGEVDYSKKTAYVVDLVIPQQKVSVAKVHDIGMIEEKSIGVMHSHHSMGNCFSSDDKETINKNNDISLLVSNKKITGQIRIKTECGCYYNMSVNVHYDFQHNVNTEEFLKDIDNKIEEKKIEYKKEAQLIRNKINGINGVNSIPRTQVNIDEDGRKIYEDESLFDYREDDEYDDFLNELDDDLDECPSDKVITYEDLINSDSLDSYESEISSDLDYLFNRKYNKLSE